LLRCLCIVVAKIEEFAGWLGLVAIFVGLVEVKVLLIRVVLATDRGEVGLADEVHQVDVLVHIFITLVVLLAALSVALAVQFVKHVAIKVHIIIDILGTECISVHTTSQLF